MAGECLYACLRCSDANTCTTCRPNFYPSNGQCVQNICPPRMRLHDTNGNCTACPYDCFVCDTNNYCLSCNATADFRELSGNRCVAIAGYFESGQTQATACPASCATCSSATQCTSCAAPLELSNGQCVEPALPCPFRQFDHFGACTACPIDCFTCTSSG
jgi:proprotein convertase subtilisin/kexin type 5